MVGLLFQLPSHYHANHSGRWHTGYTQCQFPPGISKLFPTEGTREVHLTGEARFEVAKDAERPFIVSSGKMQTQVLGTVFDVNAYPGKVAAVTLFQGRVRISDKNKHGRKTYCPDSKLYCLKIMVSP